MPIPPVGVVVMRNPSNTFVEAFVEASGSYQKWLRRVEIEGQTKMETYAIVGRPWWCSLNKTLGGVICFYFLPAAFRLLVSFFPSLFSFSLLNFLMFDVFFAAHAHVVGPHWGEFRPLLNVCVSGCIRPDGRFVLCPLCCLVDLLVLPSPPPYYFVVGIGIVPRLYSPCGPASYVGIQYSSSGGDDAVPTSFLAQFFFYVCLRARCRSRNRASVSALLCRTVAIRSNPARSVTATVVVVVFVMESVGESVILSKL